MRRRLGVVITPPISTVQMVRGLQSAIGLRGVKHIQPHITLIPPFNSTFEMSEHISVAIGEIAIETEPFEVELGEISTFTGRGDVLFYKVTIGDDRLKHLFGTLMDTGLFKAPERPFVPHVTVAVDMEASKVASAISLFDPTPLRFFSDTIDLLERPPRSSWTTAERFVLGVGFKRVISNVRLSVYLQKGVPLRTFEQRMLASDFLAATEDKGMSMVADYGVENLLTTICVAGDVVVGSLVVRLLRSDIALLESFCIFEEAYRGLGIGRSTLLWLLDTLADYKVRYVLAAGDRANWLVGLGFEALDAGALRLCDVLGVDSARRTLVKELY